MAISGKRSVQEEGQLFLAVVRDQYRKRNSLASGGQYRKRDSMASSGKRAVQEDGQLGRQWPKVSAVSGRA